MGAMSHKGSQAPFFMLVKAGSKNVHTTSVGFGTLSTDQCNVNYCGRALLPCVYDKTNTTQYSVGHINCWNVLKTGGRELIYRPS